MSGEIMTDLPVACTLDEGGLKARREGLEFAATGETLELIGRAIEAERRCCPFLRFQLTVEPDQLGIVLEVTGPAGTAEFLQALIETQN